MADTPSAPASPSPIAPEATSAPPANKETHGDGLTPNSTPVTLLAVHFKEASLDSPSFRACMNHINEQFEAIDKWMDNYSKASAKHSQQIDTVLENINYLISLFVPDYVTQGLINHDFTMLAMRRYAEGTRYFWTTVIAKSKEHVTHAISQLSEFQRTELRAYKDSRKNFENTQAKFDAILSHYLGISKTKEASAIREDAFQLAEARKAYIKACFDLCCIISTVQRKLDSSIIDSLTEPWLIKKSNVFLLSDPKFHRLGVDMHRIRSWSKAMNNSIKPIITEMFRVRKKMEEAAISRSIPSRDLADYSIQTSNVSHFVPNTDDDRREKHGWLFVKTGAKAGRQNWVRRWAFVKDGMFGWLVLAPTKNYVLESDKIGVLLCNVSPEPNEDRRFCFELRTKDSTVILQAETLTDLKSWLQAFEVSKRQVLESEKSQSTDTSHAFQKAVPQFSEFAASSNMSADGQSSHHRVVSDPMSAQNNGGSKQSMDATRHAGAAANGATGGLLSTAPESVSVNSLLNSSYAALHEPMGECFADSKTNFSTVGPFGSALVPSPMINTPMPTAMTKEAVLASLFSRPTTIPTAVTANYLGSVNWALYSPQKLENPSQGSPSNVLAINPQKYPEDYPAELRAQDVQMRAVFQTAVDVDDPMDRVVLAFRGLILPNPKQELPARIFVTPKNVYIYSCSFGFTAMLKRPLVEFFSVEGHAGTSYDTLYFISENNQTGMVRVFLDSGRIIQKRIQFLIDLAMETDVGSYPSLGSLVSQLKKIGSDQASREPGLEDNSYTELALDDGVTRQVEGDELDDQQILKKYLAYRHPKSPDEGSKISGTQIDLMSAMPKCLIEQDFDVSARTLFHIMFGEKSSVFKYTETSLYTRVGLDVTSWQWKSDNKQLEREISYSMQSKGVLSSSRSNDKNKLISLQRIERMDERRSYIVFDRRTPWVMPSGDIFFVVLRYLILPSSRTKCRLRIYGAVEWIKSSQIMRNVVESMVIRHLELESKMLVDRAQQCRAQLGPKGMAVTAVRLFGRLGSSSAQNSKSEDGASDGTNSGESTKFESMTVSFRDFLSFLYQYTLVFFLRAVVGLMLLSWAGTKRVANAISIHRLLVFGLLLSLACNLWLSARSTQSYWIDRRATAISNSLGIGPQSVDIMKRSLYLNDIDDLLQEGLEFATVPDAPCYQAFKTMALSASECDSAETCGDLLPDDRASKTFSKRIRKFRDELGVRRNKVLVTLRMLNRMEKEALYDEWQEWLVHEMSYCSAARELVSNDSLSDDDRQALNKYCQSCIDLWNDGDIRSSIA
uniref:ARAD1B18172p n=1 Tax=Blastobotrys adeninivorans TaxID=409370 RepID=A0A060T6V4_BLAAD